MDPAFAFFFSHGLERRLLREICSQALDIRFISRSFGVLYRWWAYIIGLDYKLGKHQVLVGGGHDQGDLFKRKRYSLR